MRGAFTGATDKAPGLFRAAHKGVLFLDEIGELPARGQELLLKVLDRFTVQPQGDSRSYSVDVQVLAATGRDLAALVQEGRFRHDLYQRLKPLTLRLAPLSERRGDIRPLLVHFLAEAEKTLRKRTRGLTSEALHALLAYGWPGNVRELAGVCLALVTHTRPGTEITLDDLRRRSPEVLGAASPQGSGYARETLAGSFAEVRSRFERELLLQRLDLHGWNVAEAAMSLGISAATLYRYLQRHGLRQPEDQRSRFTSAKRAGAWDPRVVPPLHDLCRADPGMGGALRGMDRARPRRRGHGRADAQQGRGPGRRPQGVLAHGRRRLAAIPGRSAQCPVPRLAFHRADVQPLPARADRLDRDGARGRAGPRARARGA